MRIRKWNIAALLVVALSAAPCRAYLVGLCEPEKVVASVNTYLTTHPKEAAAWFALGRVHMTIWARRNGPGWRMEINGPTDGSALPSFTPWDTVMQQRSPKPIPPRPFLMQTLSQALATAAPTPADLRSLASAVTAYRKALSLDDKNPRYHLALACAYQELGELGVGFPADVDWAAPKLTPAQEAQSTAALNDLAAATFSTRETAAAQLDALMPSIVPRLAAVKSEDAETRAAIDQCINRYWQRLAIAEYRQTFSRAKDTDLAAKQFDPEGDRMPTATAAEQLLLLLKANPALAEKAEPSTLETTLAEIYEKPRVLQGL